MNLLDFWPRKPKALPDELAEQMLMQVGAVSEQLAAQHANSEQPADQLREQARQVLYPLAANMAGFDWSVMYRYELKRLQALRDEDDVSTLLMVI